MSPDQGFWLVLLTAVQAILSFTLGSHHVTGICFVAFRKCCFPQHGEWFSSVAFLASSCAGFFFLNPSLRWNMRIITDSGTTWHYPFHPFSTLLTNEISSRVLSTSFIHSFVDRWVGWFHHVAVLSSVSINTSLQTSQMTKIVLLCLCWVLAIVSIETPLWELLSKPFVCLFFR